MFAYHEDLDTDRDPVSFWSDLIQNLDINFVNFLQQEEFFPQDET
jgi:hypothetical protein